MDFPKRQLNIIAAPCDTAAILAALEKAGPYQGTLLSVGN